MRALLHAQMQFEIKNPDDFLAVEKNVAALLSSDEMRCAFLRSESFVKFRMCVVYRSQSPLNPCVCWGPNGLCIWVSGSVVNVDIKEHTVEQFDDTWGSEFDTMQNAGVFVNPACMRSRESNTHMFPSCDSISKKRKMIG